MATKARKLIYPESDGKPMAETDVHRMVLLDVTERLRARYADRTDVYVSGNLFVYYSKGRPRVCVAPDAFVVFGVPNRTRRTYKVWEEKKYPDVVFEFTSARTQDQDLGNKFEIYQDNWKVKEYFLFDPLEEYLDPPLLGYRMVKGELVPIPPVNGIVASKALGITLSRDGSDLILKDAATGERLLTKAERQAASAEAEVARLKAELDALRRKK